VRRTAAPTCLEDLVGSSAMAHHSPAARHGGATTCSDGVWLCSADAFPVDVPQGGPGVRRRRRQTAPDHFLGAEPLMTQTHRAVLSTGLATSCCLEHETTERQCDAAGALRARRLLRRGGNAGASIPIVRGDRQLGDRATLTRGSRFDGCSATSDCALTHDHVLRRVWGAVGRRPRRDRRTTARPTKNVSCPRSRDAVSRACG
jgi:hypothetical protein